LGITRPRENPIETTMKALEAKRAVQPIRIETIPEGRFNPLFMKPEAAWHAVSYIGQCFRVDWWKGVLRVVSPDRWVG